MEFHDNVNVNGNLSVNGSAITPSSGGGVPKLRDSQTITIPTSYNPSYTLYTAPTDCMCTIYYRSGAGNGNINLNNVYSNVDLNQNGTAGYIGTNKRVSNKVLSTITPKTPSHDSGQSIAITFLLEEGDILSVNPSSVYNEITLEVCAYW